MIEGRLKPEERIVELGRALVKQVFSISRVGSIAGCYVARDRFSVAAVSESIAMAEPSVIIRSIR